MGGRCGPGELVGWGGEVARIKLHVAFICVGSQSCKILRYLKILELERFPCALCRGTWHHILMVTDRFSDGFRTGRYVRS